MMVGVFQLSWTHNRVTQERLREAFFRVRQVQIPVMAEWFLSRLFSSAFFVFLFPNHANSLYHNASWPVYLGGKKKLNMVKFCGGRGSSVGNAVLNQGPTKWCKLADVSLNPGRGIRWQEKSQQRHLLGETEVSALSGKQQAKKSTAMLDKQPRYKLSLIIE